MAPSPATKLIQEWDFSFLRARFEEEHSFPAVRFEDIVTELKRFFILVCSQRRPLALISHPIDELWHTFVIFTPQYRAFCAAVAGGYIDHQPNTPATPVPIEAIPNFFSAYRRCFNEEPGPIWFSGVDAETADSIRRGKVPEEFRYKWSGWTGGERRGQALGLGVHVDQLPANGARVDS